jgi:REP element-mobilizing transposase RayT
MPRKPRLHVPDGLYHVTLRGDDGRDVFFTPADRSLFYDLLAEGVFRFGYRVHAFCLMTNHVHLALQAGETPLSIGMQNLSFRYTRHVNMTQKRVGHVFQGRYKAVLVDQDAYGLALVRYIHLNPVRAKMVRQPGAYRWSSHRAYLGRERLPWLSTEVVLAQFSKRLATARSRFAEFVDAGKDEGHSTLYYGGEVDSRVVGDKKFLKRVVKRPPRCAKPPTLRALIDYVCQLQGLDSKSLRAPGRARQTAQARTLVAWLAVQTGTATLEDIARRFGRSASTMSHLVTRLEKRSLSSPGTREILQKHLYAVLQA